MNNVLSKPYAPAPRPPAELFRGRREELLRRIGNGVAIIPAPPELVKSRDTEIVYRTSSDLYYFTGAQEPEAVAVLTPHDPEHTFTLFVRPRDPAREAWTGRRLGVEGFRDALEADAVYPISEIGTRLPDLLKRADILHYPIAASSRIDELVVAALLQARKLRQRSGVGPVGMVDLEISTQSMRLIKDETELSCIRVAAEIAAAGHLAAMASARPHLGEWEIQAALESAFRSMGGASPSFPSIVASGANATVLHYVTNASRVGDEDLVLIDAGAEWGMYCSDITRTFPASGKFTATQRDLYDIVLAAEHAAIEAAKPGVPVSAIHEAATRVLARGMIDVGLLKSGSVDEAVETGDYKRFYLHQTSHWLGLDVHDVGSYRTDEEPTPLAAGMVLTVEPGLYIPDNADVPEHFRGVGIRIEDDVVITADANEVLTRGVPVEPEAIEAIVGKS